MCWNINIYTLWKSHIRSLKLFSAFVKKCQIILLILIFIIFHNSLKISFKVFPSFLDAKTIIGTKNVWYLVHEHYLNGGSSSDLYVQWHQRRLRHFWNCKSNINSHVERNVSFFLMHVYKWTFINHIIPFLETILISFQSEKRRKIKYII